LFTLGRGGVDFEKLKAHIDRTNRAGWLTVELDSSPWRPPRESARMSREFLEKTLKIRTA
jgi:sugar phosphate isomerase/epimerase